MKYKRTLTQSGKRYMKKILFIGNSHTYMNDMPELFSLMFEDATGEPCEVFMLAYSGRSLKWHMEEEYFSERFNILHGGYDYCVIQEQAHPMPLEKDTVKYAGKIIELCRQAGTEPVIFETWARAKRPASQAAMNRRYREISKAYKVLLAPVGEVWEKAKAALKDIPDSNLSYRDGAHASAVGDYLIAMVLTKTITGKLPKKNFLTSFDFSFPDDKWTHVKENIEDEKVQIPAEIAVIIRKCVEGI